MEFEMEPNKKNEYDNSLHVYRVPQAGNYHAKTSIMRTYPTGVFKDVPTGKAWFKPWTWHWPAFVKEEVMESEHIEFDNGVVQCKDGQRFSFHMKLEDN